MCREICTLIDISNDEISLDWIEWNFATIEISVLTQCGLVTQYGGKDLDQHLFR